MKKRRRGDPFEVSGRVMADALGVTIRRVQQIAVRTGHDRYDLVATMKKIRDLEEATGNGDPSISEARRRYWTARAEREELDVSERRARLVDVGVPARLTESIIVTLRARLLSMPRATGPLANPENPKHAETVLDREARAILEELVSDTTLDAVLARVTDGSGESVAGPPPAA